MEVFNGRNDLYAKRWVSNKTGKSGYSPVCQNEFSTYKCDKIEVPVVVYKGNMGKKKTKEIKDIIKEADENNKSRIILATSSSIGEGFDDSRLDTLFLTMPVSWKGRIIQYVGRLHREHEDKEKVIVYDYLDNMKVLEKMYNRRIKGYKMAGYEIIE